jgi:hypothetical protein
MLIKDDPVNDAVLIDDAAAALVRLGLEAAVLAREPELPWLEGDGLMRGLDGVMRVGKGDAHITYAVEVKRHLTPAALGAATAQLRRAVEATGHPGLLVTHCLSTPMAEKLRALNQPFADAAGNAYLEGPGLLVYVTGRKLAGEPEIAATSRAFSSAGLKVQFALICNPALADAPLRAIAAAAGVALGGVSAVLADLQRSGALLVQGKKRRLNATRRLLDDWAQDYARRLRPKTLLKIYTSPNFDAWENWQFDPAQVLWGGESAARLLVQHLRPGVLTLYAEKMPARLMVEQRMTPVSATLTQQRLTEQRVIELRRPFWGTLPAVEPFAAELPGSVPPALVYADLLATGDSRCLETAELIYDRYLARLFPAA